MKTFPCFHGRKGCAFPGAAFFCTLVVSYKKVGILFVFLKDCSRVFHKKMHGAFNTIFYNNTIQKGGIQAEAQHNVYSTFHKLKIII